MACFDSECILVKLHGTCTQMLSRKCGRSFEGLAASARHGRQKRLISNNVCKKLVQLDTTCAWLRHASSAKSVEFVARLGKELEGNDDIGVAVAPVAVLAASASDTIDYDKLQAHADKHAEWEKAHAEWAEQRAAMQARLEYLEQLFGDFADRHARSEEIEAVGIKAGEEVRPVAPASPASALLLEEVPHCANPATGDATRYSIGQSVAIWSGSCQRWFEDGVIDAVHPDGALVVSYDYGTTAKVSRTKNISYVFVSRDVRPLPDE